MRNIIGVVGVGVEHDHSQRIIVLPGHQIGDGGFIVGAIEISFCERRAEPAVVVDDDVVILGRTRDN